VTQVKASPGSASRLFPAVAVSALLAPAVADAQAPQVGAVENRVVVTLSLQVGSTGEERRQVTYTPPPGWYVRSHSVECARKSGNSSFAVSTVPQDWGWSSEEKARESYKTLIDLAGKAGKAGLQGRFALERDRLLDELRKARSSHHALVVEAVARGEGFLRGGGALDLTVTAELVYVGTDQTVAASVARHRAKLP
jgi:hypothetical protein